MAGTHWRVFGNAQQATYCFKQALFHVPSRLKYVVLANLAGLLFRCNAFDDSIAVILQSIVANDRDPGIFHMLGNILYKMVSIASIF